MGEDVGICCRFRAFIWCKHTQNLHRNTGKNLQNASKRLGYRPSLFAPPISLFLAVVLCSTLHMHCTLRHVPPEHCNPWLISSVNQWDSLVATTQAHSTPMPAGSERIIQVTRDDSRTASNTTDTKELDDL